MKTITKKVWIITARLKEENEEGEEINWTDNLQEYYTDTKEEAEKFLNILLSGKDPYYEDLVENAWINEEPEERKFLA